MTLTLLIIIVTVIVSLIAMNNDQLMDKCIFHPYSIAKDPSQWYRSITCGFIHADLPHLAFNMFSFYMFGEYIEKDFQIIFGASSAMMFMLLYFTALVICIIPTYFSHKKQYNYRSLGASGAVSAIVFVGIFLHPSLQIGFFVIPPIIPGFVFGPLYLLLTIYLSKKGPGSINHSAHLWGSLYGIVFVIFCSQLLSDFSPIDNFINNVIGYLNALK
jgi:membrane associated rhomboid family serine protease